MFITFSSCNHYTSTVWLLLWFTELSSSIHTLMPWCCRYQWKSLLLISSRNVELPMILIRTLFLAFGWSYYVLLWFNYTHLCWLACHSWAKHTCSSDINPFIFHASLSKHWASNKPLCLELIQLQLSRYILVVGWETWFLIQLVTMSARSITTELFR